MTYLFKAIVFDIGQTLVEYNKPLNWSKLYKSAFESISDKCGYTFSDYHYHRKAEVRVIERKKCSVYPWITEARVQDLRIAYDTL